MSRENARQKSLRGERDCGRFLEWLEETIDGFRFELFGFVCMPNHFLRNLANSRSVAVVRRWAGYAATFRPVDVGRRAA